MRATRVLVCLFALVVVAAGIGSGAQDGEVPLYTNEDLERFGPTQTPVPDPPPPSVEDVDRQWDFVQEHLDRERSRIETDRALRIEETLAEPAPAPEGERYVGYPIYGRFGYNGYPYRYGHVRRDRYHTQPYPYDRRTARHGYYLPRKGSLPPPETYYRPHGGKRGPEKASHGHRVRTGGQVQGRVSRGSPSRSGSPGKVTARSGSRSRSPSPGRVSSGGRSGGSSRGTAGGSRSGGRSSSRGGSSRR